MVIQKSSAASALTAKPISEADYTHAGKIMRAFAEIDDMLTLHIGNLTGVDPARATILLGRSPLSAKINTAATLAKLASAAAAATHATVFDSTLLVIGQKFRNALAHGTYLGVDSDGAYAFLTPTPTDASAERLQLEVLAIDPASLADVATKLLVALPEIERVLRLTTLRQRRFPQRLEAHPKGQPQRKKGAKHQRPPKPSRA